MIIAPKRRAFRRGITVVGIAAALVGAGMSSASATPTTNAATWLSGQLTTSNHYVVGGTTDVGLTEDGLFAFKAAGASYTTQVSNIKTWLNSTANIGGAASTGYIGSSTIYYPGSLAKTSLAVKAAGGNPKSWTTSSINLISRLETTEVSSGRFADPRDTPTYQGYANPYTQALALIAIQNQDSTFTGLANAATYLRGQACTDGGWSYQFGACATSDPDSTAAVTQALAYVGGSANNSSASAGNVWLNNHSSNQAPNGRAWTNYCQSPYSTLLPSVNSTALAIAGLISDPAGSGTYATRIANGKSWLTYTQNTDGGMPACTDTGASDVRATVQGVQGLAGLSYVALL